MPPLGFEPTISAGERPQTYTLDRAATGTVIQGDYSERKEKFLLIVYVALGALISP